MKTTFEPTEADSILNFKMGTHLLDGADCSAQKLVSSMGQGGWLIFLDQQKWLFVFGKNLQMFPEDKPISLVLVQSNQFQRNLI